MPVRGKLSPWVEQLILGYGSEGGGTGTGRERERGWLKARVTRVEHVSRFQAQDAGCPTGLLLLSDGLVLIPAVLTAAAWGRLQEQEDRDSLEGLVDSTVVIVDYRLQFHMAQEQTRCRFFLAVGQLAVTSVGPAGPSGPCCTTLASVRRKIRQTWEGLLGEGGQDSQSSQSSLDLSLLLGEWQKACLQDVLGDVQDRLAGPRGPSSARPGAPNATGWDADRVRFRAEASFSVPVKCLLIPDVLQLQAAGNGAGDAPPASDAPAPSAAPPESDAPAPSAAPPESDAPAASRRDCVPLQPPVQDAAGEPDRPPAVEAEPEASDEPLPSPEDMAGARPPSNPWDIFPPPGDSPSSSHASRAETPTCPSPSPPGTQLQSDRSSLPPYQDPPQLDLHAAAAAMGASDASTAPRTPASSQQLPASEEPCERTFKRRRRQPPAGAGGEGGAPASSSPPSWLFATQTRGGAPEQLRRHRGRLKRPPSIHSDGRSFSYWYRASGQNQQDLSGFVVQAAWLRWALRYLLGPHQDPGPASDRGPCGQTGDCRT